MSPKSRVPRRARPAPAHAGAAAPPPAAGAVRKQSDGGGEPPRLVVYVHGIGNKPRESVLRCQWDTALFGVNMGDRTRMAYWVNRNRYPIPEAGDCAGAD